MGATSSHGVVIMTPGAAIAIRGGDAGCLFAARPLGWLGSFAGGHLETNVDVGASSPERAHARRRGISGRIYYGYWLIAAAFFAQFVAAGMQNYVIGPFLVPMTDDLGWTR